MKKHILFVCMGNILRSALAEKLFNKKLKKLKLHKLFEATSRGIQGSLVIKPKQKPPQHNNIVKYPEIWKIQEPLLKKLKVNLKTHFSRPIDAQILKRADIVIVMDKKAYKLLVENFPELKNKIFLQDISDAGDSHDKQFHEKHNMAIVNMVEKNVNNLEKIFGGRK